MITIRKVIKVFHFFCGLGGGAKGFNRARAVVDNMEATFRCLGGVDVDPASIRDFHKLAGVPGTVLDLFDREQYEAWHGRPPPATWREATPADIRAAAGEECPDIVFTSPPCKGFSGLLNETRSRTDKYQALNRLTLRGLWLMLEAFADDPPSFILLENVPRIANRGRPLLDQINSLLSRYGYAIAETTHDCGELGELAQSRKRFLMVARHMEKVPPFLYEPRKRVLQSVGSVLGRMPVPGSGRGGAMHRMPSLQWRTWLRLAFVEAGADWRSLNRLAVEDGFLRDYSIVPETEFHSGVYGVNHWDDAAGTVTGHAKPSTGNFSVADPRLEMKHNFKSLGVLPWDEPRGAITCARSVGQGRFSVADPRVDGHEKSVQLGVRRWDETAPVVTGKMFVGGGPNSVADPRLETIRHNNVYRIVRWDEAGRAVTSSKDGGVADPRCVTAHTGGGKYRVTSYDEPAGTVIAGSTTGQGAFAVADPRPAGIPEKGDHYLTGGHYGVLPYGATANAVTGSGKHDNGYNSVADPRMPEATQNLVCVIRALDNTWHRPFTTLELAALQSLVDPEQVLELDGLSDSAWRERIGNAVPPAAAQAIAEVMGRTLLMAWSGKTFFLDSQPIWVQPIAVAISMPGRAVE